MAKNDDFWAKPEPGQILSGKIFVSGNSPHHVGSKYILLKNRTTGKKTNWIPGSGT